MSATGGTPVAQQARDVENDEPEEELSNLENVGNQRKHDSERLSKDEQFEILKNSRRRQVIRYLLEHDGESVLSDLAEHIAAAENDITVRELSSDQRKRVYIGLYQCHLPKMDSYGVIEYDKHRGTVELQDSVEQLLTYMEPKQPEQADNPAMPAVVLATVIVGVVTVGVLGLGPLSALPLITWTIVSVVGVLLIASLQLINGLDPVRTS